MRWIRITSIPSSPDESESSSQGEEGMVKKNG